MTAAVDWFDWLQQEANSGLHEWLNTLLVVILFGWVAPLCRNTVWSSACFRNICAQLAALSCRDRDSATQLLKLCHLANDPVDLFKNSREPRSHCTLMCSEWLAVAAIGVDRTYLRSVTVAAEDRLNWCWHRQCGCRYVAFTLDTHSSSEMMSNNEIEHNLRKMHDLYNLQKTSFQSEMAGENLPVLRDCLAVTSCALPGSKQLCYDCLAATLCCLAATPCCHNSASVVCLSTAFVLRPPAERAATTS